MKRLVKLYKKEPLRIVLGIILFTAALALDYFISEGTALPLYIAALIASGGPVFAGAVRGILRRDFLDEKFLMSIASIGAMIIGERAESIAVMVFFLVGEYFEHRAVTRSRSAIKSLMDIRPDTARVRTESGDTELDAEDVEVGSIIVIRPGERVPIDSEIISGRAELDTSALTGESLPRPVGVGDTVESGTVVVGAVLVCRTLRMADESAAARVLSLVEEATENKSKEERFITAFSRVYTPIVTLLALLMATLPPAFGLLHFTDSLYRALSFLVVSCPCALVISVPMAFFGGIGGAASVGILYKGGNVFSPISRAKTVVFDKTGTLTTGELSILEVYTSALTREELLSLAASLEAESNHPIARALSRASDNILEMTERREIAGRGISAVIGGDTVVIGNAEFMRECGYLGELPSGFGVHLLRSGDYIGSISFTDTVRPEAKTAIAELYRLAVKRTVILTGDTEGSALRVKEELGIDELRASLSPDEKYAALREIISQGEGTMYVGDGINDSPSLALADVGIAMGGGSDSAIEASDAVIMSDDLTRLPTAVRSARKTLRIAKQNIVFAIGVKVLVLALVSVNLAGMWLAVFADVGVAVLAILNSARALKVKKR